MRKIYVFSLIIVGCLLFLASCNLSIASPASAPESAPATPYVAPDYPTLAATPFAEKPAQAETGVQMQVLNAKRDGKQVEIEVCFTMPDDSDWTVWQAALQYGDQQITEFGSSLTTLQNATADGQSAIRCDTLNFYVPPDADLSTATLIVNSVGAYPRPGEYCSKYLNEIQSALEERGTGIMVQCVDQNGTQNLVIASKPDAMSQEDAEQIVYSDDFFTVKGPWTFSFDLGR
jgi:hypothetical protein